MHEGKIVLPPWIDIPLPEEVGMSPKSKRSPKKCHGRLNTSQDVDYFEIANVPS